MPTADELAMARMHVAQAEQLTAAQQQQEAERITAGLAAEKITRLRLNPDFNWFVETFIAPRVVEEDLKLHDITLTAEDRNLATHRWHIADEILRLPETKETELRAKAAALTAPK